MLNKATPYHQTAANLRENGYHAMPVWPGRKIPGSWKESYWEGMPGWAKYCDTQPPEFLHEKWEGWPDAGVCVGALRVSMGQYADKARVALKEKETAFAEYAELNSVKGGPAILRRVTENACKIALISAVGRSPANPEIDERDMDIGHAIAWWSANVMISNIASHIADNQYERDVNAVERFIFDAGEKGRVWREVQRKFRSIRKRDLLEIIEALEREETVKSEIVQNLAGGHPVKRVRSVQNKPSGSKVWSWVTKVPPVELLQ